MKPSHQPSSRLSLGRLTLFALPALPAAALSFPLGAYLPPFYADATGLSLATVGLIFTLSRLWDIATDPVMGTLSDRTSTRWGRRRPWLLSSGPILVLGVWALFFPPENAGAFWLVASLFIAFIGYTMITITHYAWASDLSNDHYERSRLQGAILIAGIFGTMVAMILPAIVEVGSENALRARVEAMGVLVLILIFPCLLLCLWATHEPSSSSDDNGNGRGIFQTIRDALGRQPFRRLLFADFAQGVAGGMLLSSFVFFAAAWLDLGSRAGLLLLLFFASGVVCVPGWVWVSGHLGKPQTVALSSALTIPVIAAHFFIPKGDLVAAGIVQILFGSTMGVWIFLTRSIIADLVDDEETTRGDRPTGTYFALATLTTKLGQACAVGIAYVGLDFFGVSTKALSQEQGPIVASFTLIPPILGHLIMIIIMVGFFNFREPESETSQSPVGNS